MAKGQKVSFRSGDNVLSGVVLQEDSYCTLVRTESGDEIWVGKAYIYKSDVTNVNSWHIRLKRNGQPVICFDDDGTTVSPKEEALIIEQDCIYVKTAKTTYFLPFSKLVYKVTPCLLSKKIEKGAVTIRKEHVLQKIYAIAAIKLNMAKVGDDSEPVLKGLETDRLDARKVFDLIPLLRRVGKE
jgi:hypothetical protein